MRLYSRGFVSGEKLSEDLWNDGDSFEATVHPDIYRVVRQDELFGAQLKNSLGELVKLAGEGDSTAIICLLDELIPDSAVHSTPPPEITS